MEDISKYLGIKNTFWLLYFVVWVFSLTEGSGRISQRVGSRVTLNCSHSSEGLQQLSWKKDATLLHSLQPGLRSYTSPMAHKLNISMPNPPDYALVIDPLRAMHRGNYTCETATNEKTLEEKWELDITEETEKYWWRHETTLLVAVTVPCVCGLIFIISMTALLCRRRSGNCCGCCCAEKVEQVEDIYENCLDVDVRHHSNKTRSCRPLYT